MINYIGKAGEFASPFHDVMAVRRSFNELLKWYHKKRFKRIQQFIDYPHQFQQDLLSHLLRQGSMTEWGNLYGFYDIADYKNFERQVPLQDYENLKPFIDRMMHGEKDVLWPGVVRWFSKSSGTTSDRSKFIPVSSENLKYCHIRGTWDTMTLFYQNRPDARQFECKSMLMGGSLQRFEPHPKSIVGDVSAIMINSMPFVGRPFFAPDLKTALLPDFEEKLALMAEYGSKEKQVVMIGGVPTWTIILLRKILELTGKSNMLEVWPDFQGYIHGGVSFLPYKEQFKSIFPSPHVSYQEIYNASEGYFAVQDNFESDDLLLLLDNGIFFEFLPVSDFGTMADRAIPIWEVKAGEQYGLVITTNSGLWRYMPGDIVKFTSVSPYKIKIAGRTKQFINVFGEEVMVENAEKAIEITCLQTGAQVSEYTVAPVFLGENQKGGHQWIIEFERVPLNLNEFSLVLDQNLRKINSDYDAKRFKDIAMVALSVLPVPKGTFYNWLRSKGKFGGQNKVPRLANTRLYVDEILEFIKQK